MKVNRHLIISGIFFTVVIVLWPVFMVLLPPDGTEVEQLEKIRQKSALFKTQFFLALLISPSMLYMMLSQRAKFPLANRIASTIGFVFLAGYLVLNSMAYGSQIVWVPKLVVAGSMDHAKLWYLNSFNSFPYFINQMGYCFWGIGATIMFIGLIPKTGLIRYVSLIYVVSGVLSVVAFAGLLIDNKSINALTLYSGMILLPIGVLTVIWGIRENKKYNL